MTNGTLDKFVVSIDNAIDWGSERSRLERTLIDDILTKAIQADKHLLSKDRAILPDNLSWLEFFWNPEGKLVSVRAGDANDKDVNISLLSSVTLDLLEKEAADWLDEDTGRYMDHHQ